MKFLLLLPMALSLLATSARAQEGAAGGAAVGAPGIAKTAAARPVTAETGIMAFDGFVEIVPGGQGKAQRLASVPYRLNEGDEVRTFRKGTATITFKDGSQVRLDPYSVFYIKEESQSHLSLFVQLGKIWASAAKGRHRAFDVRTPSAVASVRGTSFSVEVLSRKTITEVFEGAVAVEALKNGVGAGHEALLLPGQHVEASRGGLTGVRNLVVPGAAPAAPQAPQKKAALQRELKTMLAQPEIRQDADKAAAIQDALQSGDPKKMSVVASSLGGAQPLPPASQELLMKGFAQERSLGQITPMEPIQAPSQAMTGWNVSREIGLQMGQQSQHTMMARQALSPAASQASAAVSAASFHQIAAQSFTAAPVGAGTPVQTTMQAPVSPTAPAYNAAPPPPTANQAMMNQQPPASGTTCSCVGAVCGCH